MATVAEKVGSVWVVTSYGYDKSARVFYGWFAYFRAMRYAKKIRIEEAKRHFIPG